MAPSLSRRSIVVYILQLRSGVLYVGYSDNFEERLRRHVAGTACRSTRVDRAVILRFIEIQRDLATARRREAQIKKWSHAKKEALIRGDTAALQRLSRSRD
jgi:predicted GIY-YIG superfamily endonuclease